jgi:hypothetical protein
MLSRTISVRIDRACHTDAPHSLALLRPRRERPRCRMFNQIIAGKSLPRHLSSDHDCRF